MAKAKSNIKKQFQFHRLGALQQRIMAMLWACHIEGGLTIQLLAAKVNQQPGYPELAYTTILTVCRNLAKHQYVDQHRGGRSHTFSAAIKRDWYEKEVTREFLDEVFDGDASEAVVIINEIANERRGK